MKKFIAVFLFLLIGSFAEAQPPTNSAEFTYLGKKYSANYDTGKHLLTFSEELSFEIYDETGVVVKRGTAIRVDFHSLMKKGGGEKTFTLKVYKKAKKSKKKKDASIKEKGEIGTMLVTDSLD